MTALKAGREGQSYQRRSVICNFLPDRQSPVRFTDRPRSKPATCVSVNRPITNYDRATSRSDLRRVRSHARHRRRVVLVRPIGIHAVGPKSCGEREETRHFWRNPQFERPAALPFVKRRLALHTCRVPHNDCYLSHSWQCCEIAISDTKRHCSFRSAAPDDIKSYVSVKIRLLSRDKLVWRKLAKLNQRIN